MFATIQRALSPSAFAEIFPIDHIIECMFCGVAVVCAWYKALTTIARGLQRKIRHWVRATRNRIFHIYRFRGSYIMAELIRQMTGTARPYDTYTSDEEEERYWKEAARGLRELESSDAKYTAKKTRAHRETGDHLPLVMYYTPALPRYQRTKEERRRTPLSYKEEMQHRRKMTPEIYIKWHWMTHPEGARLTEDIASKKIEAASAEELREVYRLSKKLPDDHEVFRCTNLRSKKEIMATYNWRHFFSWYGAFKRREEDEIEGQFVFDKRASWSTWSPASDEDEQEDGLLDGHCELSYDNGNPFDYGDDSSDSGGDSSDGEPDSSNNPGNAHDAFDDAPGSNFDPSNIISANVVGSSDDQDDACDGSVEFAADENEEDLEGQFADWTFSNVSIY